MCIYQKRLQDAVTVDVMVILFMMLLVLEETGRDWEFNRVGFASIDLYPSYEERGPPAAEFSLPTPDGRRRVYFGVGWDHAGRRTDLDLRSLYM